MEDSTKRLFHLGHESKQGTNLEVEDIYEKIQTLSTAKKIQLMNKLIKKLTIDEMANILDAIASRLHDTR